MDNRPIGVFDSGIGGLTAVKEILNQLPNENIIYFGDTGRVPYGTRSKETIMIYAKQDIGFLLEYNIKAIAIACGTVSSVALPELKPNYDIKIIGVVKSAAKKAAEVTKNKKIGILSTSATHRSEAFAKEIALINPDIEVISNPCPLFIPLVENGFIEEDNEVTRLVALKYLAPLLEKKVDTIILGCTHFPLLSKLIQNLVGNKVTLIDSGKEAAKHLHNYLKENNLLSEQKKSGNCEFYVTDTVDDFCNIAKMFLGRSINDKVKKITL